MSGPFGLRNWKCGLMIFWWDPGQPSLPSLFRYANAYKFMFINVSVNTCNNYLRKVRKRLTIIASFILFHLPCAYTHVVF